MKNLIDLAKRWIEEDPDPETVLELEALIKQASSDDSISSKNAYKELEDRFGGFLTFGTAGLRAQLGAGPRRMNRVVVRYAAAGLSKFLLHKISDDSDLPRVAVVGYDGRYNSKVFALDTVAIFAAQGIRAIILPEALPTPLLSFTVLQYNADIGVMVTASHNPPQDNGYKVYLGGNIVSELERGAQIAPPYDKEIERFIEQEREEPVSNIELADSGWEVAPDELAESYILDTLSLLDTKSYLSRDLKIVYTPLHGVGGGIVKDILHRAEFESVTVVAEQFEANPDFPTVKYPNPEEEGALDLAYLEANRQGADIIFANDPDADRFSVAVRSLQGSWEKLSGDEIGILLFLHLLAKYPEYNNSDYAVANSLVSSSLLQKIAYNFSLKYEKTLTGFKWISRTKNLIFGYEEALGYCVSPKMVPDKDGISAMLFFAEYAADLKANGKTVHNVLDEIAYEYGLHVSEQISFRFADIKDLEKLVLTLEKSSPKIFGNNEVVSSYNLKEGYDGLPPTSGFIYFLDDSTRIIIRPSGTEPKLKCYLETVTSVTDRNHLGKARLAAQEHIKVIQDMLAIFLEENLSIQ